MINFLCREEKSGLEDDSKWEGGVGAWRFVWVMFFSEVLRLMSVVILLTQL